MKRILYFALLLPTVLAADPVRIRSGEHETFSRLVLSIGVGTEWVVSPDADGFVIELDNATDGFDTTQVFERIPRNRLTNVTQIAPEKLRLSVACPCGVDAFLWQPGELVVDIVDVSEPNVAVADEEIQTPLLLPRLTEVLPTTPNFLPLLPSSTLPPLGLQAAASETDISETETALAEGIARAATQGFLTPAFQEPISTQSPLPSANYPIDDVTEPESVPSQLMGRPGVGISTALDRDLARLGAELGRSFDQQCAPADLFDVATWGDKRSFHAQAAALAESLAGEFGEEPREAQEDLARLYIHFGFGLEAKAALAADPTSSQSRLILNELAGIVDDEGGNYPVIEAQFGCASAGGLWAFLIHKAPLEDDERDRLIRQFFELPQPLRGQLSPRVARRFIDLDDPDAASRILQAAGNNDAGASHDVQATRALVAEGFDDEVGAQAMLSQQVEDNARTTPQSLIRLINLQIDQNQKPSEANLLLAAAMRHENREMSIAIDLADAEALGWIMNGQHRRALDLVADRQDASGLVIVNQIYSSLTQDATAGTFLEFVYTDMPSGLTPTSENAIAQRLLDLGFPERAGLFLAGPAERETASERRYLRAEVALGREDFALAIDVLLGMTDERARRLRANAYEGLGEYTAALTALTPDQTLSSPVLLFRANAWERLTLEEDQVLSTFAQAVMEPAVSSPDVTLADRREILTQSQDSRRAVEGLLLLFDGKTEQE